MNVILFGDFAQLSSVSGRALFNPTVTAITFSASDVADSLLYKMFNRTVILKKII